MKRAKPLLLCLGASLLGACIEPAGSEESAWPSRAAALEAPGSHTQGTELRNTPLQNVSFTGATLEGGTPIQTLKLDRGGLTAWIPMGLTATTSSLYPCRSPTQGLARGCGFTAAGVGTCAPGTSLTLGGGAQGLGSCTGNPLMRICSGTTPCEEGGGGYLASNDNASIWPVLNFCPLATFTCPGSGRYNVLAGPYDTTQSYTMTLQANAGTFPAGQTLKENELLGARLLGTRRLSDGGTDAVTLTLAHILDAHGQPDPSGGTWPTDPGLGETYLYRMMMEDSLGNRNSVCQGDGGTLTEQYAVPVSGIFDETGRRIESDSHFTFSCTTGVIAKCYRWGYKPWMEVEWASMKEAHWACTRMARADYCGDGRTHTQEGTPIRLWDTLPPSPINPSPLDPIGMRFEAGWNKDGAICLSHDRWVHLKANICPGKYYAPEYVQGGNHKVCPLDEHRYYKVNPDGSISYSSTYITGYTHCASVCDSQRRVFIFDANTRLFNESYFNGDTGTP